MGADCELFYHARIMMVLCGIWRLELHNSTNFFKAAYPFYSVVIQIMYSLTPLLLGANLPNLFRTDLTAALETVSKFLFSGLLVIKASMCQSKKIVNVISIALKKEAETYINDECQIRKIYHSHVTFCNSLTKFSYACAVGGVVLHWEFGIADSYAFYRSQRDSNQTVDKPLPLHFWYPFDKNKFHIWVLLDQLWQIVLTVWYTTAFQIFSNSLLIFLRAQLKIFQQYFKSFHKNLNRLGQSGESNSAFKNLRLLCSGHQEFIKYINDFNNSVKNILLVEYCFSSLMFAGAVFQVMAGVNVPFNCMFVFVLFSQLILLAWNCNEIVIQSGKLSSALYKSEWYDQDIKTKVLVYIMVMRCQKPLSLTIGSFGPMTTDAVISRMKLTYSYTTVMRAD
ncbi:odorant receptor 45b-like [Cylas formicarius]|uniref:odorant receptor 45b-like n=1 Tax=Cylas formicarius TaxID=197179 RepID=UPI0029586F81|nr:odorant receptor 45b-like [Cylas formicarius]